MFCSICGLWIIFVVVVPYLGVFVYLIAEHSGMNERSMRQQEQQKSQFDDYVKSVAAEEGAAGQIAKGKELLESGTITQAEFEQMKARALA
jgi:cell division protein FtsW (lipid II flippase)